MLALGLPPYDPWKEERAHARKLGEKVAHLREELFAYEGTPQYSSMAEHLKVSTSFSCFSLFFVVFFSLLLSPFLFPLVFRRLGFCLLLS